MEFKGTKGKWFVIDKQTDNTRGFPSVVFMGTEQQYRQSYGRNGITINVGGTNECLNANALLISKAPEMLGMLKEIHKLQCDGEANDKHVRNRVLELIKQATEL